MKLYKELQASQIAQLIYLQCLKKGIELNKDEDVLYNILYAGAESIICGSGNTKDPREVLDQVDEWIYETRTNCPRYFIEEKNNI
jgi:hypothetical protein